VTDPDLSPQLVHVDQGVNLGDLAHSLPYRDLALRQNGDSGAVIPPVLHPLKALDEQRSGLAPALIAYYGTHVIPYTQTRLDVG
jgi:hypothetical protein